MKVPNMLTANCIEKEPKISKSIGKKSNYLHVNRNFQPTMSFWIHLYYRSFQTNSLHGMETNC